MVKLCLRTGEPSSEWWPSKLPASLESVGVCQEEGTLGRQDLKASAIAWALAFPSLTSFRAWNDSVKSSGSDIGEAL